MASGAAFLYIRRVRARLVVRRGGVPDRSVWLAEGPDYVLGRSAGVEVCVPDEPQLSRRHASLRLGQGTLRVERLPEAEGSLLREGKSRQAFVLPPGGSFMVGYTRFVFEAAD